MATSDPNNTDKEHIDAQREELVQYVTNHLQECDFERLSHNTCMYFQLPQGSDKNPKEMKKKLLEFNKEYIREEIHEKQIPFLMQLKDHIDLGEIKLMDEEAMIAFRATGFAYSMDGSIVIMNPR